jgi:hypothetical protein
MPLGALVVVAPPAVHPRAAAMLGDSATLHFVPHTAIARKRTLRTHPTPRYLHSPRAMRPTIRRPV